MDLVYNNQFLFVCLYIRKVDKKFDTSLCSCLRESTIWCHFLSCGKWTCKPKSNPSTWWVYDQCEIPSGMLGGETPVPLCQCVVCIWMYCLFYYVCVNPQHRSLPRTVHWLQTSSETISSWRFCVGEVKGNCALTPLS